MAAINTPIKINTSVVAGKAFTQARIENNAQATTGNILKPCFKPGCALNCKHKTATCFKAANQLAC